VQAKLLGRALRCRQCAMKHRIQRAGCSGAFRAAGRRRRRRDRTRRCGLGTTQHEDRRKDAQQHRQSAAHGPVQKPAQKTTGSKKSKPGWHGSSTPRLVVDIAKALAIVIVPAPLSTVLRTVTNVDLGSFAPNQAPAAALQRARRGRPCCQRCEFESFGIMARGLALALWRGSHCPRGPARFGCLQILTNYAVPLDVARLAGRGWRAKY
jgi:hypothetical protein